MVQWIRGLDSPSHAHRRRVHPRPFGAVGLVAAHRGRLGRLGRAGLIVEVVGVAMTAALAVTEAVVFPILADRVPTLLVT
ncbi:MAG: hypothetical protein ABJA81_13415 [Nocardioidaceae bacterium]